MSQEDFIKEKNTPLISDDPINDSESKSSGNDQKEPEVEETGSYVGSEIPYSDHSAPLEGAVGGEMENDDGIARKNRGKCRINAGKEDLFRRFFSKEYEQVKAPILERHRHEAGRQRHFSDSSHLHSSPDSSLLDLLQFFKLSPELVLNQAGAIIGRMPTRESEFTQQALSGFGRIAEDSDPSSMGSVETALIGDVYAGNFPSRKSSDSSRGLSPGSSFPSFASRPPTAASGNVKESDPDSCKLVDLEPPPRDKPERQRRFGVTYHEPIRCKSAPVGHVASDSQRKVSKDLSVCSEPLPERKVSKDSSVDSFERMSSCDDVMSYPRSVESDSCVPVSDLKEEAAESLDGNLDAIQVSSTILSEIKTEDENVAQETTESGAE